MLSQDFSTEKFNFVFQGEDYFGVHISTECYSKTIIFKTAHKFTDRCYVHVEPNAENRFLVSFKCKNQKHSVQKLAQEFCNELLEQELRFIIAQETEGVRNLIIAHAFSKTSLIEPDLETADYLEDAHHIGK
ncbi:hypothetical protein NIES4071_102930 (plasmid) [Calothrix sp. NIES-4071]|nr:hypothetical protein NIES4071_102930 [Calothrix sp. NIES-4071]BAZ64674.1 hypothetical protein NIES4105_104070 [Calothrix sp. NIES-4105]